MSSFHFSVDDVLPSLIEVTDKKISLREHPFFGELRKIYEDYGVKTGLNLFYSHNIDGVERFLYEVRDLRDELVDGWLYFAPHALNFDTPPYSQKTEQQILTVNKIMNEIDRIAGIYKASSVRFHHYSECYEIAQNLINHGLNEIFVTDKPVGSYRLSKKYCNELIDNGYTNYKGLKITRTQFRVENLANENFDSNRVVEVFKNNLSKYSRIVIYSHEYEHIRSEVNIMLRLTMDILVNQLGLKSENP